MSVSTPSRPIVDLSAHRARRDPVRTRERLIAAGTDLFAQHGLHEVTSAGVARHAGVATGTFYLHFPDKLALFRTIVFDGLAELRARQDAAGAQQPRGTAEELRARLATFLEFAEEKRALMRVLFARSAEAAGIADEIVAALAPGVERRYVALRAAGRLPAGVSPAVAAQARAAAVVRIAAWWTEDPARATRREVIDTLVALDPAAFAPSVTP
ncbi:MAG: TetR/AcrR family transcriptional regulator [Deltaproteobacteria bacterium]|nr:TetR/AcrR family transcriptional regulator [Deltaproteobacteria bacterium]